LAAARQGALSLGSFTVALFLAFFAPFFALFAILSVFRPVFFSLFQLEVQKK
jgi:hypothetical protein